LYKQSIKTVITTHVVSLNSTLFITCLMEWYSNEYSPIIYSLNQWSVIYKSYENLVVKSVSLNLFNLLGSSSASSVDASLFGFVVILSLYLTLNFVTSSLIVGIFKSVCKILLGIYHGAFTVVRRTLFWCVCNIAIFEFLAAPQRVYRNVQMGFRIVLYSGVPRNFFQGGVQKIQLRTEGRENGDRGGSPLVRGSAEFANEWHPYSF
jgi:hypothetical protein